MTKVSNRLANLNESATLAMAQKARDYKARGIDIISLSLGEPDFKTPHHICEGAKNAIDEGKYFAYPPVPGYMDLREAISVKFKKENKLNYNPSQVVVSNGAKHSIANVFYTLLNPGDEVIIFSPFWVSYEAQVQLADGVPVYISGTIENDFKATAAQLTEAITPKTKAIIFSSPCNPTGAVFTMAELQAIADVVLRHEDIYVISDEIYEHINYIGEHVSIGALEGMQDRTITVNGVAKGFAMTGWRVGYIGAPEWIAKGCIKMQGQITSANSSIAQRATLTALTTSLEPTYEMRDAYLKRRDMVYDLLCDIPGFQVNVPSGAFYFFPNVSALFGKTSPEGDTISNADDLAMYFLDHAQVSTVTGSAFGNPECLRISYAASEEELKKAMQQIKEAVARLK